MTMKVAFTGHRPPKLGGYDRANPVRDRVKSELRNYLINLRPDMAMSGMALGTDQWAAQVCIDELSIPLTAVLPFASQAKVWPNSSQEEYRRLLVKAAGIEIVCKEDGFAPWKMQLRNKWMVDNCDVLLAVFDGSKGGTYNCVNYARRVRKDTIIINPRKF